MTPCQLYFDHLVNLLMTTDALKETALVLDNPEDASIFTRLTKRFLDPLWAMSSRLWAIIRDNLIVQKTTTAVTTMRDKYPGLCRVMPGAFVGMLAACVVPAIPAVVIGGAAGMTLQWLFSSSPRLIRELPIGILERVIWPIAGAIFGFRVYGVLGAIAGIAVWRILSTRRHIREQLIGILERVTWPIAGAIFGLWLFGVLGAIAGCVLFCLKGDRYKTMIGTLTGLTEEERNALVMQIQGVVASQQREDLTSFISSQSNRKELIRTLYEYSEHPQGW